MPEPPKGDFIMYVLDGQQRLTSLFTIMKGLKVVREDYEDDFSEMYVDLLAKEDEDIVIIDIETKDENKIIKFSDLLFGDLSLLAAYPKDLHKKIDEYRKRIQAYNFSTIVVKEAPLDVATEIFTRINVGGVPLSVFEIMVAKTFDADKKFDLAEKYDQLVRRLEEINYETISPATVLQTVSILLTKECSKKQILNLKKQDFIKIWSNAADAIESTVEYFRNFYRIPVSQLLPYNALIVPFAYYFYKYKDKPTGDKQKYLQDLFWRCALSSRYSSGVEGKLAQDIKRVDDILKNKLPKYDYAIDTSAEFVMKNGSFSAGRSYIKAILCIYAYHEPKSFNDDSIVQINNNWLKQANSKNYHHFFPKSYLDKKGYSFHEANHVANITIVDDFLNKREIKANAPSKYMKRFLRTNRSLKKTMKTHLIEDLDKYGVWDDDYERFLKMRTEKISEEIQERVIIQDIDVEEQEPIAVDIEEEIQMI